MSILFSEAQKTTVAITTEVDRDGDMKVKANGVVILWLFNDGSVRIHHDSGNVPALREMGFDLDGDAVRVIH